MKTFFMLQFHKNNRKERSEVSWFYVNLWKYLKSQTNYKVKNETTCFLIRVNIWIKWFGVIMHNVM